MTFKRSKQLPSFTSTGIDQGLTHYIKFLQSQRHFTVLKKCQCWDLHVEKNFTSLDFDFSKGLTRVSFVRKNLVLKRVVRKQEHFSCEDFATAC